MTLRKASLAGSWYPDTRHACEAQIVEYQNSIDLQTIEETQWSGGIVPHAGWYFSGAIACNVIRCLTQGPAPEVVIVFGLHMRPGDSLAIMTEGAWETPLGEIPIADQLAQKLAAAFDFERDSTRPFSGDNTIEVQLPFIKYFWPDVSFIPVGVPPTPHSLEIGRKAVELAQELGQNIKVMGSTDLTHYGYNYGFLPHGSGPEAVAWVKNENDARIIETMMALDPEKVIAEALANQNACCAGAAATALAAGVKMGATQARTVAYASSHDKSPGDSFVGYAGVLF